MRGACPVRLVVPGWYGMTSVKWLKYIEVVTSPFSGFQQQVAYQHQENWNYQGMGNNVVQRIHVAVD